MADGWEWTLLAGHCLTGTLMLAGAAANILVSGIQYRPAVISFITANIGLAWLLFECFPSIAARLCSQHASAMTTHSGRGFLCILVAALQLEIQQHEPLFGELDSSLLRWILISSCGSLAATGLLGLILGQLTNLPVSRSMQPAKGRSYVDHEPKEAMSDIESIQYPRVLSSPSSVSTEYVYRIGQQEPFSFPRPVASPNHGLMPLPVMSARSLNQSEPKLGNRHAVTSRLPGQLRRSPGSSTAQLTEARPSTATGLGLSHPPRSGRRKTRSRASHHSNSSCSNSINIPGIGDVELSSDSEGSHQTDDAEVLRNDIDHAQPVGKSRARLAKLRTDGSQSGHEAPYGHLSVYTDEDASSCISLPSITDWKQEVRCADEDENGFRRLKHSDSPRRTNTSSSRDSAPKKPESDMMRSGYSSDGHTNRPFAPIPGAKTNGAYRTKRNW